MPFDVPEILTADNSGRYTMSIRLQSGGLSFSGYVQGQPHSFFCRQTFFEAGQSYETALKECFFANDFLAWDYREVRILPVSSRYTLVPRPLFDEDEKESLMSFTFFSPEACLLSDTTCDEEAVLVFDMPPDIHAFCSRSFSRPRFIHPVAPQLTFFRRQSRISLPARMYGVVQDDVLHVFCFRSDRLLLANTFAIVAVDDILYYLLYIWRHIGFDQEKDELHLFDNAGKYNRLFRTLSTYLRQIRPIEFPSEAYLLGTEMERMPIDLRLLPVCV
ncbi:MAG: DUF3822 family protein [Tannerellaceae bacterium]|jgi:hypothetical protein|nr:DUF3822 family protein [Tannerellaceae bacterium]